MQVNKLKTYECVQTSVGFDLGDKKQTIDVKEVKHLSYSDCIYVHTCHVGVVNSERKGT